MQRSQVLHQLQEVGIPSRLELLDELCIGQAANRGRGEDTGLTLQGFDLDAQPLEILE